MADPGGALVDVLTEHLCGHTACEVERHRAHATRVLIDLLPVLADLLRQEQYRAEAASRDFGPAVHPDFGPDWIVDYATPATPAAGESRG